MRAYLTLPYISQLPGRPLAAAHALVRSTCITQCDASLFTLVSSCGRSSRGCHSPTTAIDTVRGRQLRPLGRSNASRHATHGVARVDMAPSRRVHLLLAQPAFLDGFDALGSLLRTGTAACPVRSLLSSCCGRGYVISGPCPTAMAAGILRFWHVIPSLSLRYQRASGCFNVSHHDLRSA